MILDTPINWSWTGGGVKRVRKESVGDLPRFSRILTISPRRPVDRNLWNYVRPHSRLFLSLSLASLFFSFFLSVFSSRHILFCCACVSSFLYDSQHSLALSLSRSHSSYNHCRLKHGEHSWSRGWPVHSSSFLTCRKCFSLFLSFFLYEKRGFTESYFYPFCRRG